MKEGQKKERDGERIEQMKGEKQVNREWKRRKREEKY
jgi:hypothetical protein